MNLEAVAKRAGVSTATVSRVLNNVDVVKSVTRDRVMRAIADLNYHPNLHARSLAGGKSRTLGMILSNMENSFFFDIYRTLEAEANFRGYDVLVINTHYRPEHLARGVRLMIGRRVAGLAVVVSEMDEELIGEIERSRIPTVFYDVGTPGPHISNIRVNYRSGIERVIGYLYGLGHRRFGFVGHHSALGPTSERERAFIETLAQYGTAAQYRSSADEDRLDGGRDAARKLLDSGYRPTAIVCVNDLMAVGVLRELRDRGLRVPEDVSVTGFDNIKLSEFCTPQLTTLHIPRDRIGSLAAELLVPTHSKSALAHAEVVIDPELVIRESTGPAPA